MKIIIASIAFMILCVPTLVHADADAPFIVPEAVEVCKGWSPGVACTLRSPLVNGYCEESTCTYLGYPSDCLTCVASTVDGVDASTAGEGDTPAADESGGCGCRSISSSATMKDIYAFLFAGSFSLLFLLRRRKRRP